MGSQTWGVGRQVFRIGGGKLHRISDDALHSWLLGAVLLLAVLAVGVAVTREVAVWQLETAVIQGTSSGSR